MDMDFASPLVFQFANGSNVFQGFDNQFDNCEVPNKIKITSQFTSLNSNCLQPRYNNRNGNILQSRAADILVRNSDNNVNYYHALETIQNRSGAGRNRKKAKTVRKRWTHQEDRLLVRLVEQHGFGNWSYIKQYFKEKNARQCRVRWINHLRPNIKKDAWSEEEDRILIKAHMEMGKKWSKIAKLLPGRTDHSIKNHWYAVKRRLIPGKHHRTSRYPRSGALLQNYINSLPEAKPIVSSISQTKSHQFNKMHESYHASQPSVHYGEYWNGFTKKDVVEVQMKQNTNTSSLGNKKMDMDLVEMISKLAK